MSDKYQPLRDAISAGAVLVALKRPEGYDDVHPEILIDDAAIHPTFEPEHVSVVAALLRERDALRDALSEAQTHIAAIGYPASPDGEYSKDGEWTFSDAVPRAVDAGEVKAAFLVLRAALADGEATNG